ncbi:MAG: hydrogenase maturation nickel metallochaperone HypA [Bacteroidales bacterium]|nr:hydrogenase maturation nickel metallochaperone HypA [Bacteroidales bacterium]
MHELSIAMSIVEIVEEQAKLAGIDKVHEVELDIGKGSGVVIEALKFSLDEAVRSSVMEQSVIKINEIPSKLRCTSCGHEFEPEDIITPCPACGHLFSDVLQGSEMKVRKIVY